VNIAAISGWPPTNKTRGLAICADLLGVDRLLPHSWLRVQRHPYL